MRQTHFRRPIGLVLALALLCACLGAFAETAEEREYSSVMKPGYPWDMTSLHNNLPEEAPREQDDFYTAVNYRYLYSRWSSLYYASVLFDAEEGYGDKVAALFEDPEVTSPLMEKMRILYEQAKDWKTLEALGTSEVQPYLDRIDAVTSVGELSVLLAADDFPFTPFMDEGITTEDMSGCGLYIDPNFLILDSSGARIYAMEDFDAAELNPIRHALNEADYNAPDALQASGVRGKDLEPVYLRLFAWERQYGQYAFYDELLMDAEVGTIGQFTVTLTLEELEELCGAYPIRAILARDGRDGLDSYWIYNPEWLSHFGDLYTEENLDTLKIIAKAQVMKEALPYIRPAKSQLYTKKQILSEKRTVKVLSDPNTFGPAMFFLYRTEILGEENEERLRALSLGIRDEYKTMIEDCSWLEEESRKAILRKLDGITFLLVGPDREVRDYSGVEPVSTEDGGSLFTNYLILKQNAIAQNNLLFSKPNEQEYIWAQFDPSTVNACYFQGANVVLIFPGFLNSAVFRPDMTDEELTGTLGNTVSHEIGHGLDYVGIQIDGTGSVRSMFTEKDEKEFFARQRKLAAYLDSIEVFEGLYADGWRILNETCSDITGLRVVAAYAEKNGLNTETIYRTNAALSADVVFSENLEPLLSDCHALSYLRVNVSCQMDDVFYEVFGVAEGDRMYLAPEDRIGIW